MLDFRLTLYSSQRRALEGRLETAEKNGNLRSVRRISAILSLSEGLLKEEIAAILRVSAESVRLWLNAFLIEGVQGIELKRPPGRPSKLTKTERRELAGIIDEGPAEAGFLSNCWRTPMIQHLIHERYGVFYDVHYLSQLQNLN